MELKNQNIELKKQIEQNKAEIDELKNITNIQTNEINEHKNAINELKKQMKLLLNYKNNENENYFSGLNSLVINGNSDYNSLLKNWISPNNKIKSDLLYRLTRDGNQFSKFHQLCDNQGPTLTLLHVEDGNKVGIYTPLSWDSTSGDKKDLETFMFNLNKNEKYKKLNVNERSIYCGSNSGPFTTGFGFYGDGNNMGIVQYYGSQIDSYFQRGSRILSNYSKQPQYFNVLEVEIYKIIFE